jgi:hypothetical protein
MYWWRKPEKTTDLPKGIGKYLPHNAVSSMVRTRVGFELTIGTDCIDSCKSKYLTITTTTAP